MNLREDLIRGIYAYGKPRPTTWALAQLGRTTRIYIHIFCLGFECPSAIQQRAIKPMVSGHDVIAQSQSGTGKTATISIAILQSIDIQLRVTQALCISPTRELAVQTKKVCVFGVHVFFTLFVIKMLCIR